ncbi:unnamed protein product [Moneuplotes crassus]|uniref:Uncharacterized protein n=1 Tax=Euplotes crassus TaxID=5936 RepID=A0AAD1U537_EUPCR|nr:unnamed protein product [Moneuplotes crassus]
MEDSNQSDDTLEYDSTEEFIRKFIPNSVSSLEGWKDNPVSKIKPEEWKNIPRCIKDGFKNVILGCMLIYQKFKTEDSRFKKLENSFQLHKKAKYSTDRDLKEREKKTNIAIDNFKAKVEISMTRNEDFIVNIREKTNEKLQQMLEDIEQIEHLKKWVTETIEETNKKNKARDQELDAYKQSLEDQIKETQNKLDNQNIYIHEFQKEIDGIIFNLKNSQEKLLESKSELLQTSITNSEEQIKSISESLTTHNFDITQLKKIQPSLEFQISELKHNLSLEIDHSMSRVEPKVTDLIKKMEFLSSQPTGNSLQETLKQCQVMIEQLKISITEKEDQMNESVDQKIEDTDKKFRKIIYELKNKIQRLKKVQEASASPLKKPHDSDHKKEKSLNSITGLSEDRHSSFNIKLRDSIQNSKNSERRSIEKPEFDKMKMKPSRSHFKRSMAIPNTLEVPARDNPPKLSEPTNQTAQCSFCSKAPEQFDELKQKLDDLIKNLEAQKKSEAELKTIKSKNSLINTTTDQAIPKILSSPQKTFSPTPSYKPKLRSRPKPKSSYSRRRHKRNLFNRRTQNSTQIAALKNSTLRPQSPSSIPRFEPLGLKCILPTTTYKF